MIRVEDPDPYRAMTFATASRSAPWSMWRPRPSACFTAGVTASPEFMLRNFLRDSLSSWAISKDGFRPVIDPSRGEKDPSDGRQYH